jgi:rhodanese-related sulfurtransferase
MAINQISPQQAFEKLTHNKHSILIDVRTPEELNFVGIVDSAKFDNRMLLLPWQILPNMQLNPNFSNELMNKTSVDQELIFLCRTGVRSQHSAELAKNLGYENCFNVTNGFEGDLNEQGQRGKINGWKASNLSWRQG